MLQSVLSQFGLDATNSKLVPFGNGLINSTWKVYTENGSFILQQINTAVFKIPEAIMHNISLVSAWLSKYYPKYSFTTPVFSTIGSTLVLHQDEYYRLFPFVQNSHSIDVVTTPAQAYEAATQFGRFTKLLSGFDATQLRITIPDFHNLKLRYQQFLESLETANQQRISTSAALISTLKQHSNIVDQYVSILSNPDFKIRVTHHDTKISNVLFGSNDKGVCVIDLDTLMPGYFISDVGDMMRTYLCPVSEEESDYSKIIVRKDFYEAIVQGYFNEMKYALTETEKGYFFYAGKFMIYMQALRFLTDYLLNDIYYGEKYPAQNFIRAGNQAVLLQRFMEMDLPL
jgi:Ser/Thr protein kinase RdoA (MazF antagonist)